MTDYTKLVKALRYCAENGDFKCGKDCPMRTEYPNCLTKMDTDAAAAIEALQAQLPKRGKWILKSTGGSMWTKRCSVCGAESWQSKIDKCPNYCENCGAKMEANNG